MVSIPRMIQRSSQWFADDLAIVFGEKRFTFRETNARVNRLANGLSALGIKKGDRIVSMMNNCHQRVEIEFALCKKGFVGVNLNARNSEQECSYIINHSEAKALIFAGEFRGIVEKIKRDIPSVRDVIFLSPQDDNEYEALLKKSSASEPQDELADDDLLALAYTSGTTGKPKGVMLTHKCRHAMVLNMLMERDIRVGDVMVHVGPMSHATGTYVLPHYLRGATNIIHSHFDPEDFLATVEKERVTTVMMVPTMVIRLLSCDLKKYNLKSLRKIMYGAAPMPVERLKEAIQMFGNIFSQGYGLTEAPMTVATLKERDHFVSGAEKLIRRLGSVGRPYINVNVKIADDDGKEMPVGEVGEILVKSDHLMAGYWRDPEATREVLKGGWLYTGDVGKFDDNGFLYIVDRKKDMLISGGYNIYPKEVEDAIYKQPAVKEVAVIGIPDPEWGESVMAVVVLKEGMKATQEDIINACKDELAGYKKPRSVEFVPELPKNPTGKIEKKSLREKYSGAK